MCEYAPHSEQVWAPYETVCFLFCHPSNISLVLFTQAPTFAWHHRAIWNVSCSQDTRYTQVPTRVPRRVPSRSGSFRPIVTAAWGLVPVRMYKQQDEANVSISSLTYTSCPGSLSRGLQMTFWLQQWLLPGDWYCQEAYSYSTLHAQVLIVLGYIISSADFHGRY